MALDHRPRTCDLYVQRVLAPGCQAIFVLLRCWALPRVMLGVLHLLALPALAAGDGCAFDFLHHDKPCCGQDGTGAPAGDPHVCTPALPVCTEYVFNKHYGFCANMASGTAICDGCLTNVITGSDAAQNDIPVCGSAGCACDSKIDRCVGPVSTGSAEHKASCCALCSVTAGCIQWVVSLGSAEKATCWLKDKKGAVTPNQPKRLIGEVAPVYTQTGCPPEDNWGSSFLLVFTLGFAGYAGGGSIYGARTGGGGKPSLQAHPHYRQWGEARGLCQDGVRYIRSKGSRGRGSARAQLLQQPAAGLADRGDGEEEELRGDKKEKRKKEKRSSGGKKEKPDKEDRHESDRIKTQAAPAVVVVAVAVPAAEGTASAGGGRWVHVPT